MAAGGCGGLRGAVRAMPSTSARSSRMGSCARTWTAVAGDVLHPGAMARTLGRVVLATALIVACGRRPRAPDVGPPPPADAEARDAGPLDAGAAPDADTGTPDAPMRVAARAPSRGPAGGLRPHGVDGADADRVRSLPARPRHGRARLPRDGRRDPPGLGPRVVAVQRAGLGGGRGCLPSVEVGGLGRQAVVLVDGRVRLRMSCRSGRGVCLPGHIATTRTQVAFEARGAFAMAEFAAAARPRITVIPDEV